MDRAPGTLPNTASRLIAMAVLLTGAEQVVMEVMRATPDDFAAYRAGTKEPSWPEFDRLVQLVVDEQTKAIQRRRAHIAHVRKRLAKKADR